MVKGQSPRRLKLIDQYYKNKIADAEILLDNVWDPHNAAAVIRSCDGLGIKTINLYYSYNQFPNLKRQGKRASGAANKWIMFNKVVDIKQFAKEKKKEGFRFLAADLKKGAKNLSRYRFPKKCMIILGNENLGISDEVKKVCDETVFIPMVGMTKSYNISVSAAIILYELFRQKGGKLKLRI